MRWIAVFLVSTGMAEAQCRIQTTGSHCVTVPQSQRTPPAVAVGDVLPRGEYSMVMNAPYYGLPRAQDGWVYFRVERDIVRVQLRTMEVLEIVTNDAARNAR